jgi:translation initiation factor 1 (eIF-1/SUI1)
LSRKPKCKGNKNQSLNTRKINLKPLKLLYIAGANSLLSVMAEVCSTCGLPKDLCVCGEIEKEQQRIRIRLETRKFGKATTIIDGMDQALLKNSKHTAHVAEPVKTVKSCFKATTATEYANS